MVAARRESAIGAQRTRLDRLGAAAQDVRFYNADVSGWQYGVANQDGIVKDNEADIRGITINANAAGGLGSGTAMFDCGGHPVGIMVGPAAELGASVTLSQTEAAGINDLGTWLGGWLYQKLHP